ncbi:YcaO-like family protein [Kutzneria sp. NPDC052558]|uniref:YcaO-like family protein n=1 Tax=Kutzneria sp. NPDC052558 TaxID=3364121 RepID=UPI0037C7D2D3
MSGAKVHIDGTHRVRPPEQTWDLVRPLLPRFGVTRVADVTGLDVLGVPVAMAVRPLATTLSVSQGKGATQLLATVSAAMEAIELWHAEIAPTTLAARATPSADLDLPYSVRSLDQHLGSLFTPRTRTDWVLGSGLRTGRPTPLPLESVHLIEQGWRPLGLRVSTNGLASGNSAAEAALHALYELIERDALGDEPVENRGTAVDPATVDDPLCAELIGRVLDAGAFLEIRELAAAAGVPCFACRVWSADFPVAATGSGAHSAPGVALSRAVTEAAQSRLTAITGSRDDLAPVYAGMREDVPTSPRPPAEPAPWSGRRAPGMPEFDRIDDELAWLAEVVTRRTGAEPIVVDLSSRPEFAVVRVVAPGLTFLDGADREEHRHAIR